MSRVCQLLGISTGRGCNVSHSNRHTLRTYDVNLHTVRVKDPATGQSVKLRLSARGIKTLRKKGLR